MVTIANYKGLKEPDCLEPEALQSLIDEFLISEQWIDGVRYIKFTKEYFTEIGKIIRKNPEELCTDYWENLVQNTKNKSISEFMKELCETQYFIKLVTKGKVDFMDIIGRNYGAEKF